MSKSDVGIDLQHTQYDILTMFKAAIAFFDGKRQHLSSILISLVFFRNYLGTFCLFGLPISIWTTEYSGNDCNKENAVQCGDRELSPSE